MDIIQIIQTYYVPIIIIVCLCIGYIIKKWDKVPDKYIPTIVGVLGIIFGFITNGFTFDAFASGLASGLCSTGLHQAFKQLIENRNDDNK